jgi:anti-sigma B factor antagonist
MGHRRPIYGRPVTSVSFAAPPGPPAPGGPPGRYGAGVPSARHLSYRGDWVVVEVTGDLDLAAAPALRQEVLALLQAGHRDIVVDLTPTDFLDSIGLGVLVSIWKRVRVHGGSFAVVCPEPRLQRVFRVVDLDRILPLHGTVDEALGPEQPTPGSVSSRE